MIMLAGRAKMMIMMIMIMIIIMEDDNRGAHCSP
jgi:hypothetical protein